MNNIILDMDPLNYENQYVNYPIQNPYYPSEPSTQYAYEEFPVSYQTVPETNITETPVVENPTEPDPKDVKPDLTNSNFTNPDIKTEGKQKKRGKTSNFWSKKINDKDFAFYGCSVCNIAYTNLTELDQHVTIHTNRLTSYDLRLQNLKKRKHLKKIKKKMKKEKVKQETDIEIKPEDGYIGTEKATDFIKQETSLPNVTSKIDNHGNSENKMGNNENMNHENQMESNKNQNEMENNENEPKNNVNVDNQNTVNVYKCFGCNKQFALSYYLKIHVRSHTDEKPYTCSVCGHSFITASHLGRHNKRIHLAIRHQCRICYKFFTRFELLVKHFDKKHAEDKLEGEPYDYNTILPYLKELEEQQKLEQEKKPKVEDPWDQYMPDQNTSQNTLDSSYEVEAKLEENVCTEPQDPPIKEEEDTSPLPTTNVLVEEIHTHIEIKEEVLAEVNEPAGNDDEDFRDETGSGSDEEYFPSDTWAKPPSPSTSPKVGGGKGTTTCQVCNKKLSTKSYLRVHMRTHTGEKPFTCYICNRGFITASKMHRHVLTHDESWEGNDDIKKEVQIKTENGEEGTEEKIEEDSEKKKPKTKKGKKKMLKPKKTLEKKLYGKRPHVCEFCNQRFLHTETLQVHRKSHEGEALTLQCHYCLEPAPDRAALTAHEATHTGLKPYLCTLCGNGYKKRETMVYHRKNHKPSDAKTFICDICSKKFNSQPKLQRHIISHSVAKFTLRYECPVCAHMFHTRYHTHMHLNTHIKEGLILEENRSEVLAMVLQNARKIPKCNENTSNIQENVMTDERSRICNICGQIFQHFYYLEEHLKTHGSKICAIEDVSKEEEKKYTCQVCSKSFKLHYYLKLHSYTHTKEKPFICQQCGKGFITKGKLKRHLETHQGLKKYQCHICYKFFTRPSYLRIHVRTIHGTQDYNFRDYVSNMPVGPAS